MKGPLYALLFALGSLSLASADKFDDDADQAAEETLTANINVKISASFPSSEIFGVKLVNGHATEAVISLENNEPSPVVLQLIGGSLWTPDFGPDASEQPRVVRNLNDQAYRAVVPAGEKESFGYRFSLEMHPADMVLKLSAILSTEDSAFYTLQAFEGNVSVVEAPQSIFDPKLIFLYIILGTGFAATAYFVYNTWITALFPQQKRRPAATKTPGATRTPKKDSAGGVSDGPSAGAIAATATGSKVYDESWIPAQHLKKPEPKRVRSGTPTGVKVKKAA